jgi:two-component system, chemotaxis family, protein-glutamate methylesterase/glutaminase
VATPLRRVIPATAKIRVLVVDDSVVIRRLVTGALSEDPGIEVVASAANGAIALQRIPQVNPDVITLDIEMPDMDGLETLRNIRKSYSDIRVIMFSTLTQRGAAATLEALVLGADDYVTKAANVGHVNESLAALRNELVPRVNQFFLRTESRAIAAPRVATPSSTAAVRTTAAAAAKAIGPEAGASKLLSFKPMVLPKVLAIGVSTGGPTALSTLVPMLPNHFRLPVLIVQHMPPLFTRLLAERLQKQTDLRVVEAAEGNVVEPGCIYVAPGDYHMRVRKQGEKVVIALDQAPPENSCRPAVDVMFRSVEEVYGGHALTVVLTGMGQDGLRGVELLKAAGAYVIAQDEATSVVWGMPGAIARAKLADAILGINDIVPEILRHV